MTAVVTLNSLELHCDSLDEEPRIIASDWIKWDPDEKEAITKLSVFGSYHVWRFECWESGTAWASTHYKSLKATFETGDTIALVISIGGETVVSVNVQIIALSKYYEIGDPEAKRRRFTVAVKEAK